MASKGKHMLPRVDLAADVYTLACERTAEVFSQFDQVLLLFSGGKDSATTLEIALEVAHSDPRYERHLPLRTVFQDEEAIPVETEEYVRRTFARPDVAGEWFCLPVKHRNACSRAHPWWYPWAPEDKERWCRPFPPEGIYHLDGFPHEPSESRLTTVGMNGLLAPPERGNTAMLMGIRAEESIMRHRAVTAKKHDNYINKFNEGTSRGNMWKAYPIYDWKTGDVWTAAALKGWDYNHAYDRLEMAGVPRSIQRCSPAFGEEPLQKLYTYASCFPDVWEKMAERVPGVGAAVRYALTELYSYHGQPQKPPGMPWPEFISHYLSQFRPGDAAFIAERIKGELNLHFRKTSQPVVARAGHPQTGVSWSFLLTLAMRGDFKGRKQAGTRVQTDGSGRPQPRYWQQYVSELITVIGNGTYPELANPPQARIPADPWSLVPEYAREGIVA